MATILSSLIGSCIKKIQDIAIEEAVLILGVKEELTDLQQRMKQIQCFLSDAEQRSITESAVNNWLGDLRDAMYDADNIIDLARFKGTKLLEDHPSSSWRKPTVHRGCSPLSCIANIQTRRDIAVQIRSLNKRIERISKNGMFLKLDSTTPTKKDSMPYSSKTSPLIEPDLVGKEIKYSSRKLVDLVLTRKQNKSYKVAITGIGGVGKTTLAQTIYNDQKIKGNFNKHAWICVSQTYNEVALLKEVLRNIGVYQEQGETVAELKSKLSEAIEDQSFFLVLDDVWQSSVWNDLLKTALHASATVVILMTTRDDTVVMEVGTEHTHRVDVMPVEVAWELLWRRMNIKEGKEVQNLKGIGTEMVRKCGYLPLAIKVTARVLANIDQTENEWNKILRKISFPKRKLPDDIEGALYISYDELPHHLKQCFLYCAMYPEDSSIYLCDLIRLWVAEGFVEKQPGQLLEETAEEYYYELIHRNLLEPNTLSFSHEVCKMHDLLRQLACYLSKEECFIGDLASLEGNSMSRLRRISVVTKKDIVVLDKEHFKVRTFFFKFGNVSQGIDTSVFKKFLYLRVLDLTNSSIQTIPGYIGNLIHLRLLGLNGTKISCLPECISSLINLQMLNLQSCRALHSLPFALTQLCNLRRLGLRGTPINQVPKDIGRLEFLNDLEGFIVGGGGENGNTQDGWMLDELEHLSHLRRLTMIKLESSTPYSTDSLLTDKRHLKLLNLCCTNRRYEPYSEEDVSSIEKIFEQLIPPHNLEDLEINGFFGRRFPAWLGTTHLSSIKYLALIECNSCMHLPSIGQLPNLRYLKIDGAAAVTKIGPKFVGCRGANPRSTDVVVAFPKLEMLSIRDMPNLEEWSFAAEEDAATAASTDGRDDGSAEIQKEEAPSPKMQLLPGLKRLEIVGCPKLRALPRQLGQDAASLKVLHISGAICLNVVEDFPFLSETLVIQSCYSLERVSNLPQVRDLRINDCPRLWCVEGLGSLQQMWLTEGMKELSSLWIPGLQQQHLKLHGEDMDVYAWT